MLLEEVPIAVDSFNHPGSDVGGPQIYFLSHAHEDHLKGLNKKWRKGRLFASEITCRLLKLRWPSLHLTVLQVGQVHRISLDAGLEIEVYLIDANHVPGSVMFLFSGYFGSILYTGDFRLHPEHAHISQLPMLRDKELSRIYLDNTFCDPRFRHLDREEVTKKILRRLKRKWPCIAFIMGYKLGKEDLLLELCQKLRTHLVVSDERYRVMLACGLVAPRDDPWVRKGFPDPSKAPEDLLARKGMTGCIWLVSRQNLRKAMQRASDSGAPAHGIEATGWTQQLRQGMPSFEDDDSCFVSDDGICSFSYSDHCSYLELVQFLQFLPAVPVTFLTDLSAVEGQFSYDGSLGLHQLLEDTGVPSIRHYQKGTKMDHYKNSHTKAPKRSPAETEAGGESGSYGGG